MRENILPAHSGIEQKKKQNTIHEGFHLLAKNDDVSTHFKPKITFLGSVESRTLVIIKNLVHRFEPLVGFTLSPILCY